MTRSPSDDTVSLAMPDLVLAAVPAPLLAAVAIGWLAAVQMATAVAAGSVPSMAVMGYALFLNPPA